jgi:dTDP-4-dehydrorhamnose reductase
MWLLVGGDSEIGAATLRHLRARGAAVAATTRRPERVAPEAPLLDLLRLDGWAAPPGTRGACVLAAVARLAACEADPAGSAHINVTQTSALIERLIAAGIALVFISTDKVFDGTRPQMPADAPAAPACEYGRQKAQVELLLRRHMERGAGVAILRLSKVVAPGMALFRDWIAALRDGRPIRAFRDLMFAPVPIALVSATIAALLDDRARGIFQLSGPRDISYADAARFLSRRLGADETLIAQTSAREAALPAGALAPCTSLDSTLLRERYGIVVPDAGEVLGQML